ncbi:hypothetical protein [Streptomyces sp. VRA16 Mangrove soil]|uniref:hypothetical protein n=1 Tax=Streptomyces sp. VRA16 Mangrove soil TaxID=2817434 RepID=UPI001A9E4F54|nr:hypothetical protein [Streptomyces sp. VRA16 Mangrove soil]MBO1329890.1 hypothetical protein [Streptomyces sp. VRA16 Mangrove soil]
MSDPLSSLALTGASTIVTAMATTAWESARDRVVAVFRRHSGGAGEQGAPERSQVYLELEASAAQLRDAADPEAARQELQRRWQWLLEALLRASPDAVEELRALTEEVGRRHRDASPRWNQSVVARDGGSAFGALGPGAGVHVHYHGVPEPPAAGRPGERGESDS